MRHHQAMFRSVSICTKSKWYSTTTHCECIVRINSIVDDIWHGDKLRAVGRVSHGHKMEYSRMSLRVVYNQQQPFLHLETWCDEHLIFKRLVQNRPLDVERHHAVLVR